MTATATGLKRAGGIPYTVVSICLAGTCTLLILAAAPGSLLLPAVLAAAALARRLRSGRRSAPHLALPVALLLGTAALLLPAALPERAALAGAALFLVFWCLLGAWDPLPRERAGGPAATLLPALAWAGAARLLPELRTFDGGTFRETLVLGAGICALPLLAALLLRWARPPRAAGLVLLLLAPAALAFTTHRLQDLTDVHGVSRTLQALGALLPRDRPPPFLAPGAEPPLLLFPSQAAVLLLQLGLAAPFMLVLGAAAGSLGPLPRPTGWALALALGTAVGPLLPGWLLAAAPPLLGLLWLGRAGAYGPRPAAGRLLALLLATAAILGGVLGESPPRLAAPLAAGGGRVPRECWAGRLGLATDPQEASFLDGTPLGLTPRQQELLATVEADPADGKGKSTAFLPPGVKVHPSWATLPLLGTEPPSRLSSRAGGGARFLVLPDLHHRRLAALLSSSSLSRLARGGGLCRLALRLDRLGPMEIGLLCRRLRRTGAAVRLDVGLDRLSPPLLLASWGRVPANGKGEGKGIPPTPGWRLVARGDRFAELAGAAPLRPFAPWALGWAPLSEPILSRSLTWLARAGGGLERDDPATAAALLALAARWDPTRPDAGDARAPLIPTVPELEILDGAARQGGDPWLLAYMVAAGEQLLHPRVQLLERARPHLELWQRRFPERPEFARLLGALRVRLLEYEAALPLLRRAHRSAPGERRTCRELGLAHFGLEQYAPAAHWLERAAPDPRHDPEAVRALALALHRSGRPGAASLLRALQAQVPLDREARAILEQGEARPK